MFENTYFFWFFLAIPVIILFLVIDIIQQRIRSKKIAGSNIPIVIPYHSEGQKWLKLVFYVLAFSLAIIALARPRWGIETINTKVKGRDVLILLDSSYSMAANDVVPSRFESAKRGITELLEMETGDRIGLMVFSGESELVTPVTHDYAAVSFFLDSLYPGVLGKDGTDIGNALSNAIESFDDEGASHKMILLLTDGENLQGNLNDILKKISESGIKIFTAGVGTKKGEPIPIRNSKGEIDSYVKDNKGSHVISRLDENMLKNIASSTNGQYLGTTNKKGSIKNAMEYIKSVEKKEQKELQYEQKQERYDLFLIPALLLFCIGFILDQGKLFIIKNKQLDWLFNKKMNIVLLIIIPFLISLSPIYSKQDPSNDVVPGDVKQSIIGRPNGGFWGNISFKKEKYKKALQQYVSALNFLKKDNLAKLNYNIGNVYYKLQDPNKASEFYQNALSQCKNNIVKSDILYNLGLIHFKTQNYIEAANLFKNSILLDQEDDDARYNYAIAKELIKESQRQNKQQKKQEQNQDQNNKQQQMNKEDISKLLKALEEKEKKENKNRSEDEQKRTKKVRYW